MNKSYPNYVLALIILLLASGLTYLHYHHSISQIKVKFDIKTAYKEEALVWLSFLQDPNCENPEYADHLREALKKAEIRLTDITTEEYLDILTEKAKSNLRNNQANCLKDNDCIETQISSEEPGWVEELIFSQVKKRKK